MYWWHDKYRPRKPKYFNRVHTGYEWNKYNQTHYDHDNPPPKVVQGYKFNVLYPDLLDKTRAPTYKIEREGGRRRGEVTAKAGEDDTCIIRFVAGAPYEDIAFKIVDREWDYSAKRERGFRSLFDKGILQLHFQFKKVCSGNRPKDVIFTLTCILDILSQVDSWTASGQVMRGAKFMLSLLQIRPRNSDCGSPSLMRCNEDKYQYVPTDILHFGAVLMSP